MTPDDLAAHNAWVAFYTCLSARDIPPKYQGHTVHDCRYYRQFVEIGAMCAENGYDVEDYVDTVLGLLTKASVFIRPKDLLTWEARANYQKMRDARGGTSELQASWTMQERQILQAQALNPTRGISMLDMLCPSSATYDSWFRVMYPGSLNPKLVEIYGQEAWREIQCSPALYTFLQEKRPLSLMALQARFGFITQEIECTN